jgi:hypothetical protein
MKIVLTIFLFIILVFSGVGASVSFDVMNKDSKELFFSDTIELSKPIISENNDEYLYVELDETNGYNLIAGEPILPAINKQFTFPWGTKITNVDVSFTDFSQYTLSSNIVPAPSPVTIVNGLETRSGRIQNKDVYFNNELYPKNNFKYDLHAGLDKKEHVIILNLRCYPVQYNPVENFIKVAQKINIYVGYELPKEQIQFPDDYDMVVIAPNRFSSSLDPLIEHKNSIGIKTTFKSTQEIYDEYPGRDQPEKIKYFIQYAIENWGISYVLLVGGKKSLLTGNWGVEGPWQSNDDLWHVPVRYNTLLDSTGEAGCLTDLYFSDIYKMEGNNTVFDDWDSDNNDVFAEWTLDGKDILDLYPDVYVGRLACRNKVEVKVMVNKIIKYETESCDPSWFNRFVGVGGDSFDDMPPLGDDYYEGEERNQLAFDYLSGFTPVRLWSSNKGTGDPVPSTFHIVREINKGCGFLYIAGHGSPFLYNTHWVNDYGWNNTPGGINIYEMLRLRNGKKLPICMIAACHNSEFNVSFFNYRKSPLEYVPTPECWSWMITRKIGGGAIATIGYTGLEWVATFGWDTDDIPDCTQYYSGFIDSRFFHAYGVDGIDILGEACAQAISEYLGNFTAMNNKWDCKTAQQWHLLGDPSLKIGGY